MRYLLACLALTIVGPTWAHDADPHYNRISLTASASNEVQQDELQAGLYAMHEDKNARTSANAVSTRI
jgi:predicted secreted protein